MGKIISIVGNLGAGKTTLTKLLCEAGMFIPYWEKPEERPFQADFCKNMERWALANQMDFFLFRCDQEYKARQKDGIAIMDGGFDQDFHVFTKNLYHRGYLLQDEFNVCKNFYGFARSLLAPPEIFIRIVIDLPELMQRRSLRERKTVDKSFTAEEFTNLEMFLDDWLTNENHSIVIRFAFDTDIDNHAHKIEELALQINNILIDRKPMF